MKTATAINQATSHFNRCVSQEVREKLFTLAEAIEEDFISEQGEVFGCSQINNIQGFPVSGFIPFQKGGFEITELYPSDIDSSYHFTKTQTETMEKQSKDCWETFLRDVLQVHEHNRRKEDKLNKDSTYEDLSEAQQEQYSEYEREWFEPALLRVQIFVEEDRDNGEQSIFLRLGINYRDQPYYREKYDETIFEFSESIEEFLKDDITPYIDLLKVRLSEKE